MLFVVNGKYTLKYVHHLVLETFIGPRPKGQEARHLDGKVENNTLSNLQWSTHAENAADQILHGTDTRGERNGQAKLSFADADFIRSSHEPGNILAHRYGVSEATICRVRKGLRYAAR